jgi:2-haloacid dehalogenase
VATAEPKPVVQWAGIERPGVGPFIATGIRNVRRRSAMTRTPQAANAGYVDPLVTSRSPSVLVFDVNETLIDIEAMTPLFTKIFGEPRAMREWFSQLVMYSMTTAMSQTYVDYFTLGQAVLRMVADIHAVHITDDDVDRIREAMLTMPAHPDVAAALTTLRNNGFRLVTLTNSPPGPHGQSPLLHAGLGGFFERQFSVDACRTYKPDPAVYRHVCHELAVAPSECMMVAAHVWDTIGAQSVGFSAALVTRSGNAPLLANHLPQADLIVDDLHQLAQLLAKR